MFPEGKQLPVADLLLAKEVHLCLPLFHGSFIELFDTCLLNVFGFYNSMWLSFNFPKFWVWRFDRLWVLAFCLHFFQFIKSVLVRNLVTINFLFFFGWFSLFYFLFFVCFLVGEFLSLSLGFGGRRGERCDLCFVRDIVWSADFVFVFLFFFIISILSFAFFLGSVCSFSLKYISFR